MAEKQPLKYDQTFSHFSQNQTFEKMFYVDDFIFAQHLQNLFFRHLKFNKLQNNVKYLKRSLA